MSHLLSFSQKKSWKGMFMLEAHMLNCSHTQKTYTYRQPREKRESTHDMIRTD